MKKFFLIIPIALIFLGAGCTSGEEQKSIFNSYKSETTGETVRDCGTLAPSNPYDEGSGHYAGFEWGESGKSCGGNSNSFIEGCEDFQSQEENYANCLNK